MAGSENHDIGEVWGKVENLEANLSKIGDQVSRGLTALGDQLERNSQRFDARINSVQERSDLRFEQIQQQTLSSLAGRSSQQWQVFAYIGSTILGLAAVGATFWGLTKAPIDASFARQDATSTSIVASIDKLNDKLDNKYVPREEVDGTTKSMGADIKGIQSELKLIERENSRGLAERTQAFQQIAELREQDKAFALTIVPRQENENRFSDLTNRIEKLFDRLNIVQGDLAAGSRVGDRINRLADQVEALTNKFIVTHPKEQQ